MSLHPAAMVERYGRLPEKLRLPCGLTARQRAVLDVIVAHIAERGRPPSFRELLTCTGLTSVNTMCTTLDALERKGRILRPRVGRSRQIEIPNVRWKMVPVIAAPAEGPS